MNASRETILPSQCLVQGFLKIENMTIDGVTIHSPKRDSNGFITFNNGIPPIVGSRKTKMAILKLVMTVRKVNFRD